MAKNDDNPNQNLDDAVAEPLDTEGKSPDEAKAAAEDNDSDTAGQVQEAVDVETEQGFRGVEVDPTPNENYTLAGQNEGAPTPETDPEARETARQAVQDVNART